jgi:hypothetical protein
VLIVSGFDRLDRFLLNRRPTPLGEDVVTMDLRRMNPFDTAVAHGAALESLGWPFDTVADEVIDRVDLSAYDLVWWVAGEESSGTESLSSRQQVILETYLDDGGALWISGAEILWDLDFLGSDEDRAFARDVLGATMAADAASSDDVRGEGLLEGVGPMDFGLEDGAPYPVEFPDALTSERDVVARYASGEIAGVLDRRVAMFGYPFETIGDPDVRVEVARRILGELVPDYEPPTTESEDTGVWEDGPDETPGATVAGRRVRLDQLPGCGCASSGSKGGPHLAMMGILMSIVRRRDSRA